MKKIALLIIFLYSTTFALEIPQNERIDFWVNKFTRGSLHNFFQNSIDKSTLYRPEIIKEFKRKGLPIELSWLPLVESGFDCSAKSKAKAAGCWQFMKKTGEENGLDIGAWEDQRYNFHKSTIAASKYLSRLHLRFKDWDLALSAYNWGPTRLRKRIKKNKTNDFWKLNLPDETKNYVSKFHATLIIVNDLKKYNFIAPKNGHISIKLKKGFYDLRYIAKLLRVKYRDFERLNPGYKLGYSSPGEKITLFLERDWNLRILESFEMID